VAGAGVGEARRTVFERRYGLRVLDIPREYELKAPPEIVVARLGERIDLGESLLGSDYPTTVAELGDYRRAITGWQIETQGMLESLLVDRDLAGAGGGQAPARASPPSLEEQVEELKNDLSRDVAQLKRLVFDIQINHKLEPSEPEGRFPPAMESAANTPASASVSATSFEYGSAESSASVESVESVESAESVDASVGPLPDESAARAVLDLKKRAVADLPAEVDLLGVRPLVMGLHALVNDTDTVLPLAVAITAPWGRGKSSVMAQLRNALVREPLDGGRTWTAVEFAAWKYEQSERLWAAMAKAIYEQPLERMTRWERIRFRLRLQNARNGGWTLWGRGFALPLALALATVALAVTNGVSIPATATGAGLVALTFGDAASRVWGLVTDPFKRAIDSYVAQPKYENQLGFTSEADADIGHLVAGLTREPDQALVIFVDDLDRCNPDHVVEVVDAINQIFNSAQDRKCLFILGMDREIVASSIEIAYAPTIERLSDERRRNFGFSFLSKLVQLSVSLPEPAMPDIARLLAEVTGQDPPISTTLPDAQKVERYQGLIQEKNPESAEKVQAATAALSGGTSSPADRLALDAAMRIERGKAFSADSDSVREAEQSLLVHLPRNPRDVKRFDNAFRLQLHVANGTKGCQLEFGPDDLITLGKWVALRLRWPDLAAAIDAKPALLERLERTVNDRKLTTDEDWDALVNDTSILLSETDKKWLGDPGVRALLRDEPARYVGRLSRETFLRVA